MRLDDQFHQARTNILMMSELPTIQAAYSILVQEERHTNICKVAVTILGILHFLQIRGSIMSKTETMKLIITTRGRMKLLKETTIIFVTTVKFEVTRSKDVSRYTVTQILKARSLLQMFMENLLILAQQLEVQV